MSVLLSEQTARMLLPASRKLPPGTDMRPGTNASKGLTCVPGAPGTDVQPGTNASNGLTRVPGDGSSCANSWASKPSCIASHNISG